MTPWQTQTREKNAIHSDTHSRCAPIISLFVNMPVDRVTTVHIQNATYAHNVVVVIVRKKSELDIFIRRPGAHTHIRETERRRRRERESADALQCVRACVREGRK